MTTHHAIIGAGLTAAEFAATARLAAGDRLTIIAPDVATLGRGVAYATAPADAPWRYAYLLNSPSYAVDPDFARWMEQNRQWLIEQMRGRRPDWLAAAQPWLDTGDLSSLNAPREIYGDFSQRRSSRALAALRDRGVEVQTLAATAIDLLPDTDSLQIALDDGRAIRVDSVDAATGGPINQRFEGDSSERSFAKLFGHERQIARQLGATGSIICLGANATMLDLLRFCQSIQRERDINFTAISLHGELPDALIPSPGKRVAAVDLNPPYASADAFLQHLFQLKRDTLAAGENFEELRAGLRQRFMQTSLTSILPNVIEARKVARPLYRTFQGGTRDSVLDFIRLANGGHTRNIAGEVLAVKSDARRAEVSYRDHSGRRQHLLADLVVNCAGAGRDAHFDPLTDAMLQRGWIGRCEYSGGIVVGERCQTTVAGLRYFGPAVTTIGDTPVPIPYYDALRLRLTVQALNQPTSPAPTTGTGQ